MRDDRVSTRRDTCSVVKFKKNKQWNMMLAEILSDMKIPICLAHVHNL